MSREFSAVMDDLEAREPLFHRPERGTTREAFDALTAEDFWEVGASGARYDREFVWTVLQQRYGEGESDEWSIDDFMCRRLRTDVYLVTYRLRQRERLSRRATIWERGDDDWRAIYHQGSAVNCRSERAMPLPSPSFTRSTALLVPLFASARDLAASVCLIRRRRGSAAQAWRRISAGRRSAPATAAGRRTGCGRGSAPA
jgi:hypothetical protein